MMQDENGIILTREENIPLSDVEESPHFMESSLTTQRKKADLAVTAALDHNDGDVSSATSLQSAQNRLSIKLSQKPTPSWRQALADTLFERNYEKKKLFNAYSYSSNTSTSTFTLISGQTGSGKTRLAQTLRKPVEDAGGYFLTGKFDQLRRPVPYIAYGSAFTEFTHQVIARGKDTTQSMRDRINIAVGNEAHVLTSVIPALEILIGKKDDGESCMQRNEAIQRWLFTFRRFTRAVCSPEEPVVLLLDDLHFADKCSLDILAFMVADSENRGLVVIGTCDDSEITAESYLSTKLREMEDKSQAEITNIALGNMGKEAVNHVISEIMGSKDSKAVTEFGNLVWRQTEGNVFYLIELLRWLHNSDLLYFDDKSAEWVWDAEEIDITLSDRKLNGFLFDRLQQLPRHLKDVLKVASCLGPYPDAVLIEHVLDLSVGHLLEEAKELGILSYDEHTRIYMFENDCAQQAAYELIPVHEKELFHLEVGRRLWRKLSSEDELDRNIFQILSQMQFGRRLIARDNEKIRVASLCHVAGLKAARCSTFRVANAFLSFGVSLLSSRSWRDNYDLSLALYNATAETEMCLANFEAMENLLKDIFIHARSFRDKLPAYSTQMYALNVRDRQRESLDLGVEVLRGLGEKFPRRYCKARLLSELRSVKILLRGKSDEQLLRLPAIQRNDKLQALQVLQLMVLTALSTHPDLAPFVISRMVKITLEYGMSPFASGAFATYAMIRIPLGPYGNVDEAIRFGNLGMAVLERYNILEYAPRVYAAYYGCVWCWKFPLKDSMEPLLRAHRIGIQTGDSEFAVLCADLYLMNALEGGVPLDAIDREWTGFFDLMVSRRHETAIAFTLPWAQAIHHFMGYTDNPLLSKGDLVDYDEAMERSVQRQAFIQVVSISCTRMMISYVFNDYDQAARSAETLPDLLKIPPSFERVSTLFYSTLTFLAVARTGKDVRRHVGKAKEAIKTFRRWATDSPKNCLDKLFLLQAELFSVLGKHSRAYEKYIASIACAKDQGFLLTHALANERAARHLYGLGRTDEAFLFFENACKCYGEWHGHAKVTRLKAEVEELFS